MLRQQTQSFSTRVEQLLDRVQYKRIETPAELDSVLHLRYLAYLKEGAIAPSSEERLVDTFDEVGNVHNFGIYIDGELASAVRIHVLREATQNSPALESFRDELLPFLQAGETIIDPNRFVVHPSMARRYPELPFITIRPAYLASAHFGASKVTMTCRAEHQAFYKRHIYARSVCLPRAYPLLSKPISLMLVDFARDYQRILDRNPFWHSSEAERRRMFGTPSHTPSAQIYRAAASAGMNELAGTDAFLRNRSSGAPQMARGLAVGE